MVAQRIKLYAFNRNAQVSAIIGTQVKACEVQGLTPPPPRC